MNYGYYKLKIIVRGGARSKLKMAGILRSSRNNEEDNQQNTNWDWYRNTNNTSTSHNNQLWQQPSLDLYPGQIDVFDSATTSRSVTINCQDCGNQAKQGCTHLRCRTCCKSQGLVCSTHVRSTWIPTAKRRERQPQIQRPITNQDGGGNIPRRYRDVDLPATLDSPGLEMGEATFPEEVSSDALFRCVRMSGADDGEGQYAYQTTVRIAGHLFKGILYNQGPKNMSMPATQFYENPPRF